MYYEINVSRICAGNRYSHYFATHERSLTDKYKTRMLYEHFVKLFPAPEFEIIVTLKENTGREIDPKKL